MNMYADFNVLLDLFKFIYMYLVVFLLIHANKTKKLGIAIFYVEVGILKKSSNASAFNTTFYYYLTFSIFKICTLKKNLIF